MPPMPINSLRSDVATTVPPQARHGMRMPGAWALFCVGLAIVCVQVLCYAYRNADPVVRADQWVFLDTIVRPYASGDLNVFDLFYRRGVMDHAQPLRKLILLADYEWFDLDYRVEAMLGTLAACCNLLLFWRISRPAAHGRTGLLAFVALAAVYLSVSTPIVFVWPLLNLNFTSHTFLLLFGMVAWNALRNPTPRWLAGVFAAGFFLGIVADDTAELAMVAMVLALALEGLRQHRMRESARVGALVVMALIAYKVFYRMVAPDASFVGETDLAAGIAGMFGNLQNALDWIATPLTMSVVHGRVLNDWFDDRGNAVGLALAGLLSAGHAWFWWKACRGRSNMASFVAVNIMLLFYGHLLGILLVRGAAVETRLLWQPRYAMFYRGNLTALLLMLLAQLPSLASGDGTRAGAAWRRPAIAVIAVLVLAAQLPLGLQAWSQLQRHHRYQLRQATAIGQVSRAGADCVEPAEMCRHADGIRFLKARRLSVFSPKFAERHPDLARAAQAGP